MTAIVVTLVISTLVAGLGIVGYVCERHGFTVGRGVERREWLDSIAEDARREPSELRVVPNVPRGRPYDWATEPDLEDLERLLRIGRHAPKNLEVVQ